MKVKHDAATKLVQVHGKARDVTLTTIITIMTTGGGQWAFKAAVSDSLREGKGREVDLQGMEDDVVRRQPTVEADGAGGSRSRHRRTLQDRKFKNSKKGVKEEV